MVREAMDLLDKIAQLCEVTYLSDLHSKINFSRIKNALSEINADEYDILDWCNAIKYVFGFTPDIACVEEAREYLISKL